MKKPKRPSVLGQNLRRIRMGRSLDQDALAELSGIRQPTISGLETGRQQSALADVVGHLAKALEVSTDELLGVREESPPYGRPPGVVSEEEKLLQAWRSLSGRGRITLMGIMRTLLDQEKAERKGDGQAALIAGGLGRPYRGGRRRGWCAGTRKAG